MRRWTDAGENQQYSAPQNAECLDREINLRTKIIAKTYKTVCEMPRTSELRGLRQCRILRRLVMSLNFCVCVFCPSLCCESASPSVWDVLSCLCMMHMKQEP